MSAIAVQVCLASYMADFVCFSEENHIIFSNTKEASVDLGCYNSYNSIKPNILTAETSVFHSCLLQEETVFCFEIQFMYFSR